MVGALNVPAIDIDRDPAHEAAQHELAKPIYATGSAPTQHLRNWIDEHLVRLLSKAASVPGSWFTVTVLAILLGIALVVAIRMARRAMRTNRTGDYRLFGHAELSAAEHRAAADACAQRGDYSAAIRHRLRAVARSLEESGLLNPSAGRTANELARAAGAVLPGLADEFSRAARVFNDVTYGEQPGTLPDYRLVSDLDDHLRSRPVGAGAPIR